LILEVVRGLIPMWSIRIKAWLGLRRVTGILLDLVWGVIWGRMSLLIIG
jgi:hypothetical protein